jgi:hypothetical protein
MSKSNRPIISIHNIQTDEYVEREMNDAEFSQHEKEQADLLTKKAEAEAKAAQKAALLERLGITEDEARLLLG